MTTISTIQEEIGIQIVRGDSVDFLVTVSDDQTTPVVVNLTQAVAGTASRPAIVRFAVKTIPVESDDVVTVLTKSTQNTDEIEVLTQSGGTLGQCKIYLDKDDTETSDPTLRYRWDLEISRQDAQRTGASAGTITLANGSMAVVGATTAFQSAKVGDILQPLGTGANLTPAIITAIASDTACTVDWDGWVDASGVSFEIRRGQHSTCVRGVFTIESGVVSQ